MHWPLQTRKQTTDTLAAVLPVHGLCPAAALLRLIGERAFPRRSRAQRRSPLEVRGRLLELRRRARPRLPRPSTLARILMASKLFGAALATLADSAL